MNGYAANVVPGDGAVARWESGLIIAGGTGTAGLDLVASLSERLGETPAAGVLIEALRADLSLVPAEVDLVAAISTPGGMRVFVRGGAQARTETNELIAGPDPTERDLADPAALWLGLTDPPTVQGHGAMNLRLGVVTGSGVVLHRPIEPAPVAPVPVPPAPPAAASPASLSSAPPSPASPSSASAIGGSSPPAPAPASVTAAPPVPEAAKAEAPRVIEGEFNAIDWKAPAAVETREPLAILTETQNQESVAVAVSGEQVMGIRCSRDHFNNPNAGYCQVCGISMVHLTHRLEPGPRPTLGFMVFADGATYAVDRQYLIGRMPEPSSVGAFTALQTQDATQSVSREHAELRLDGWDVLYVDLGSTNGSFLWDPSARRWDPIQPNTPVILTSGATVSVGRMTFVFEAASRPVGNS